LTTNRAFKHSICPLERNLTVYIHRQPIVHFADGKEVIFHVSLARKVVIFLSIAFFHSRSNIASRYDLGRDTDNLVAKLKYVGDNERKITLYLYYAECKNEYLFEELWEV